LSLLLILLLLGDHRMNTKIKRFYTSVDVVACDKGFAIELDKRAIKSPGLQPLVLPHATIAESLATEWREQKEHIDQATMPVLRFAGMVTDNILPSPEEARTEIVKYAHSDLLCYQSDGPKPLIELQKSLWEPVLAQFQQDENISFITTSSISYVEQSADDMDRFAALVVPLDGYELGTMHVVTTMSGSALLAMALHKGWLTSEAVWQACHVDEDFQSEQWGTDDEEQERRQRRYADFCAATMVYQS
jgi:chaperone required for assembly of F1-ATPase